MSGWARVVGVTAVLLGGCRDTNPQVAGAASPDDVGSIEQACLMTDAFEGRTYVDGAARQRLMQSMRLWVKAEAEPLVADLDTGLAPVVVTLHLEDRTAWGKPAGWRVLLRKDGVVFTARAHLELRELHMAGARLALFGVPGATQVEQMGPSLRAWADEHSRGFSDECSAYADMCEVLLVPLAASPGPDVLVIEAPERFVGGGSCHLTAHYSVPLAPGESVSSQLGAALGDQGRVLGPAPGLVIEGGW